MLYDDEPSTLTCANEHKAREYMAAWEQEQDEHYTREAIKSLPQCESIALVVHNKDLGKSNITDEDIRIVKELHHGKIWNR